MASNDYDDLLESFMNNSQKVYNDDKNALEKSKGKLPSSYSVSSNVDKRGDKSRKKSKGAKSPKSTGGKKTPQTPAGKFFSGVGKFLLALIMICAVVFVVCFSVITIYGYSVVYGDPVFNLSGAFLKMSQ